MFYISSPDYIAIPLHLYRHLSRPIHIAFSQRRRADAAAVARISTFAYYDANNVITSWRLTSGTRTYRRAAGDGVIARQLVADERRADMATTRQQNASGCARGAFLHDIVGATCMAYNGGAISALAHQQTGDCWRPSGERRHRRRNSAFNLFCPSLSSLAR